jgi:hypothetical protein
MSHLSGRYKSPREVQGMKCVEAKTDLLLLPDFRVPRSEFTP